MDSVFDQPENKRFTLEHIASKITSIDKYRSGGQGVNKDYDAARVVLTLSFPRDLSLYYKLKSLMETCNKDK